MKLKPCPCGETPTKLEIIADHDRPKWAYVIGNCCGEWTIEYRNMYHNIKSDKKAMELAETAWNGAPRANDT